MVLISQLWIQHRYCGQIIGHCHFRVGTEIEPELGGALFSALMLTMENIERTQKCCIAGAYGFQLPDIEGMGIFTAQNKDFRLYFLCEGLYHGYIPDLENKKLTKKIKNLFYELDQISIHKTCRDGHKIKGDTFWYNLVSSIGLGGHFYLNEIKKVFPLRLLRMNLDQDEELGKRILKNLENIILGSLGLGWIEIDEWITQKIEGILINPEYSFDVFNGFFQHFKNLRNDFEPHAVILAYKNESLNQIVLLALLTYYKSELTIRFCHPINAESSIEDSIDISSPLQSFFLTKK
jgi:hypothetical protein